MNFGRHPYRTVSLLIVAVMAFWALVGYGLILVWDKVFGPQAPTSLPSPWPSAGGSAVRTVPLPTGEMVAALPARTAADALCTAIPEQTWSKLLGGPIALEVDVFGYCHVVTATLSLDVHPVDAKPFTTGATKPVRVGGHDAILAADEGQTIATLFVTVARTSAVPGMVYPMLDFDLTEDFRADSGRDLVAMVQAVGDAVVPAVTAPGLPLPPITAAAGELPPREVGGVPGFGIADSAYPMAAWQLCTQLAKALSVPIAETKPKANGACDTVRTQAAFATASYVPPTFREQEESWPDTVAGRPARFDGDGGVEVKLRDDSNQSVRIFYSVARSNDQRRDVQDFAELVLPPLLGR
ncbi:hypothetical protein [Amycolatopsis saalfeldensis]|uniref:Uncharacterized protein n=1 Tax=Amycolatopsis saalfeldensis TaxID=394193 RepID=A0A1H8SRW1_9PSEU|nr:hypothetical protein [Amycolatopsis saalfeldensis]SEO81442.1 hypothetical protein SAMN04489732_102256 [Amycolatopsis saalfeldensis]